MKAWPIIAACLIAVAYLWGRHDGARLCEAAHASSDLKAVQDSAADAKLLAVAEQTARTRATQLEDQAHAQAPAAAACLPLSRVLRLDQR